MVQAEIQEFLSYVISQLIDHPEEMVLESSKGEGRRTIYKLRLRQSDVGKVIGKQGCTIAALRSLLSVAAERSGEKAVLEIIEDGSPR